MIKFRDTYIIDADERNYIIKEIGSIQDKDSARFGEETITNLGYYVSLERAILGLEEILIRRSVRDKEHTLKSIVEEIRALRKEIKAIFKGE